MNNWKNTLVVENVHPRRKKTEQSSGYIFFGSYGQKLEYMLGLQMKRSRTDGNQLPKSVTTEKWVLNGVLG